MGRVKRKAALSTILKTKGSRVGRKKKMNTKKKLREQLKMTDKVAAMDTSLSRTTTVVPPSTKSCEARRKKRKKTIKHNKDGEDTVAQMSTQINPQSVASETGGSTDILLGISGMERWEELGTPQPVIRALHELGFTQPTAIQREAIPLTVKEQCDIIGAAETGSGKTLAFGIPILHYILNRCQQSRSTEHAQFDNNTHKVSSSQVQRKKNKEKSDDGEFSNVIDLNEVLHAYPRQDGTGNGRDDSTDEELKNDTAREEEYSNEFHSSSEVNSGSELDSQSDNVKSDSEDLLAESGDTTSDAEVNGPVAKKRRQLERGERSKTRHKGLGLVTFRDNISEEEFQKMLKGEILPWDSVGGEGEGTPGLSGGATSVEGASHGIKDKSHDDVSSGNKLIALILTPTRELALQVQLHIKAVAKYTEIKVCAIVGGMATEKQERVLKQRPPIVVATPGRLWKLMSEGVPHLAALDYLKFLVLDEADRMVEFGHFKELAHILDRINGTKLAGSCTRQTLVYSATLTVQRRSTEKKRKKKTVSSQENIDNLMHRAGLKEDARVVDLTHSKVTVETLTETKIMCTNEEKDVYLYYFLLLYPGRTLVFVNSIDRLQKLRATLELLKLHPLPLHARMQQRQRLKNVDRFVSNPGGLLVASDVAARGLDFPQVEHIIHYQVPRNSELYVHRSGRTARACREGLSVMLVGPEDLKAYRNICRMLSKDKELPNFPVDSTYLRTIRQRARLARQINDIEHRRHRAKTREQWLSQSAKALDIELDEDLCQEQPLNRIEDIKLQELKAQLAGLLKTAVVPQSVSVKFPTRDENHRLLLAKMQANMAKSKRMSNLVVAKERDALTVAKRK